MGRKKKDVSELSKKSLQIRKSNFKKRVENIKAISCQVSHNNRAIPYLENDYISECNEDFCKNLCIGVNESVSVDSQLNDSDCQLNEAEKTEKIKKCLKLNAVKYGIQRTCVTSLLKGLGEVFPDLPKDYRSLLKTPRTTTFRMIGKGIYVHFSLLETLQILCRDKSNGENLVCDFFVDGVAFFSDCKHKSFWTILGRCDGIIFPVGFFNGDKQPHSFNELLLELVEDVKKLSQGFIVKNKTFGFNVGNFCADTPAKAHLRYSAHATGYSSCMYCYIQGYYSNGMIFDEINLKRRTNEEFLNQIDKRHHRGKSILETELNLHMIHDFPADVLHVVYIGVFKKMLKRMFRKEKPQLPIHCKDAVSKRMIFCNNFFVTEIHRQFRSLNDVASYHGNECRNILLKFGPIILHDLIPHDYYMHFLLLHVSISILCDKELCLTQNEVAKCMLDKFINDSLNIYGLSFLSHTTHMLEHLPEVVKQQQLPLDVFSCFAFESYLYDVKRSLKKKGTVLQQIHRRVNEKFSFDIEKFSEDSRNIRYIIKKKDYISVILFGKKFSCVGCKDRFILGNDENIYVIVKIKKAENKYPLLMCRKLKNPHNFYEKPIASSFLNIYECKTQYADFCMYEISYCFIKYKMQAIPFNETSMFAVVCGIKSNDLFVVPNSWVFDEEGELKTFYPKNGNIKKIVSNGELPENDWDVIDITMLKNEIDSYQLAHSAMMTRELFTNTASENEALSKSNRHKNAKKRYSSDEYDFNDMITSKKAKTNLSKSAAPKVKDLRNKKSKKQSKIFATVSNDLDDDIQNESHHSNFENVDNVVNNVRSTNSVFARESLFQGRDFSPDPIQNQNFFGENSKKSSYENGISLHIRQQNTPTLHDDSTEKCITRQEFNVLNEKLDNLTDMHLRLISKIDKLISPSMLVDNFFTEPIASKEAFLEREKILSDSIKNPKNEKATELRKNLINFYFPKLRNKNARTINKNGLTSSLFDLYFENSFIKTLGWTSFDSRLAIKDFDGHINLFYETVNKNTPNTFTNVQEAGEAVHEYLRRFHENINKKARGNKEIESNL